MKATHLLHGKFHVTIVDRDAHTVWATYVGPTIPENRAEGQCVLASRTDLFTGKPTLITGKPTLTPIESPPRDWHGRPTY